MHLNKSHLESVHARLRYIRALANLTRKEIAEKYKMPEITLKKWEIGKISISKKGIARCLAIYRAENIIFTEDWLRSGTGFQPRLVAKYDQDNSNDDQVIIFFKEKYQNCIVYEIIDEAMLPQYRLKEIVIGNIYNGELASLHNVDCIIAFNNQEFLLRKFIWVNDNAYSFIATNTHATNRAVLTNEKFIFIAPVAWHKIEK